MVLTTEQYLKELIERTGLHFIDVTSGNDLTNTGWNEYYRIQVFFPNAEETDYDNEEYGHFELDLDPDDELRHHHEHYDKMDDVVLRIKKYVLSILAQEQAKDLWEYNFR